VLYIRHCAGAYALLPLSLFSRIGAPAARRILATCQAAQHEQAKHDKEGKVGELGKYHDDSVGYIER